MRVFDSRDTMALYRSVHAFWQFAGKYFPFILFSEKGILPMEHDFSGSVRAVTWENPPQTKEEALERIKQSPLLYAGCRRLGENCKESLLEFCRERKALRYFTKILKCTGIMERRNLKQVWNWNFCRKKSPKPVQKQPRLKL